MRINTNIVSLNTQNLLRKSNASLETHMTRLSSGKRINTAADDAAGIAIATRMESKIRGMEVGLRNSNDGISLVQTAESALGSISNILQRMRELSVQSVNGTNNETDRASLNNEFEQLITEIDHISGNTSFNGVSLLASESTINIQLSDVSNDVMGLNTMDASAANILVDGTGAALPAAELNIKGADAGGKTGAEITNNVIKALDTAITNISNMRAEYGANLNRLNFNVDNIASAQTNLNAAKSRIEDADMSAEVSAMTKDKILVQAGMAMLSQSNQNPQQITQLLQG